MVRVDNMLTVDKTVIDALNALIDLFKTSDFKNNTEVQDLNKHLIKLKNYFKDKTNIEGFCEYDFGKYGQLPS